MKRKILFGVLSVVALVSLSTAAFGTQKSNGEGDEAGFFATVAKPINWFGDNIRSGNLLFGMTTGQKPETSGGIPDVIYVDKEPTSEEDFSGYVHHIYKQKTGVIGSSSSLNLVEKANREREYDTTVEDYEITQSNPQRNPVNFITAGKKTGETIVSEGKKIDYEKTVSNGETSYNDNFDVKVEMLADGKKNRIMHNFFVTNVGDSEQTIYPMKMVDTELAYNDKVPIFARGDNSGVYIKPSNELTLEEDRNFRLDYYTDVENGPISYHGYSMTSSFQTVFGDDMDNPETPVANMAEGEVVMGEGGPSTPTPDTAIFMHWGKKVLQPGETVEMSYAVGISVPSALEVNKTGENQTSTDGQNRVGDVIKYTITAFNRSKGELNSLEFVNKLSEKLAAPTDITVVDMDGVEVPQADTVYDDASHTITIKAPKLEIGKEMSVRYLAQLKPESAETMVENKTTISAIDEINNFHEETDVHQLDVLGQGKLLVEYQDTAGTSLAVSKSLTGSVGDAYDEEPIALFGYTYQNVNGNPQGNFTKADQTVTFIYDQAASSEVYDLLQTVVNDEGVNVDKGEAAVNDVLTYRATLTAKTANLSEEQLAFLFENVVINEEIAPNLDNVKAVTLTTEDGTEIGTADYDEQTHQVTAKITDKDNLKITDKLILSYKAAVKAGTPVGTKIKQKATADVSFDLPGEVVYPGISNEVETTVTKVSMMIVHYVNEAGNDIHEPKNYELPEDGSYDEKEIDIDGFTFDHAEGKTSGTVEPGESVSIIFHYKSEQFQLNQEVSHLDGSEAEVVKNEAKLLYTIKLTSQLKDKAVTYNDFKITEAIDPSLENIKDVKLVNSAGETVGKVEYANDLVTATITETDEIKGTENLVLTYQATVKSEDVAPEGTEIKEQAIASGSYKGEIIIPAREQTSNEVISVIDAGELIFESAPEILGFGDNNKISSKDEKIELVTKDQNLSVRDLRGSGNQWSMTVRLVDSLANGESLLAESLYYIKDGNEQIINENTSAAVYEKTTDSKDTIHISDEWTGKNKPILKVRAGAARIGNYQGTIQWSLQDVPNLE